MKPSTGNSLRFGKYGLVRSRTQLRNVFESTLLIRNHKKSKIVYCLCVKDIDNVADEILGRSLTQEELRLVVEKFPNHINWFEPIETAINELNLPE